jgi:MFS family permease
MIGRELEDSASLGSKSNTKTLFLASLGSALEFYDFIIFVFFTTTISSLFFPSSQPQWFRQIESYSIFAAGYVVRPVGGIILAHFGDTRGRKRIFTLSLLLMACPTLFIGMLPTYDRVGIAAPILLLVMRMFQGLAIGGEAPGAWVYVAEHAKPGRTGFAIGTLTSGLSAGILLGSLMAISLNLVFTPAQILGGAWRIPFLFGGVFGFCAVILRRWLSETDVFRQLRLRRETSQTFPFRVVLARYKAAAAASIGGTCLLTGAIVVIILMTPALLQHSYGLTPRETQWANLLGILTLCFSTVVIGSAADRFGVRRLVVPVLLFLVAATYALYMGAGRSGSLLALLYVLAGFGAGGSVLVPITMVRAFPPFVRFTGLSFSYNTSYAVFGGITPIIVSWLARSTPLAPAHFMAIVGVIGAVALLLAPVASLNEWEERS